MTASPTAGIAPAAAQVGSALPRVALSSRLRRVPFGGRTYLHVSQVPLSFVAADQVLLDVLQAFGAGRAIPEVAAQVTDDPRRRAELGRFLEWLCVAGVLLDVDRPDPVHSFTGNAARHEVLWLFPTNSCNLRCVYCYASSGPGAGPQMQSGDARIAIDAFFAGLSEDVRAVTLKFHGGGEPTTAIGVLRDGWRYFAAQAAERGLRARASTITNGFFPRPVLDLLSEPEWSVMFSFDGPRQAAQRPTAAGRDSRQRVLANMRALAAVGKRVSARATLTADGLASMDDLVADAAELGISAIQVEPASIVGRGGALADGPPDPLAFAEAYLRAFDLGLRIGVAVSTAAFSVTRVGDGAYCGASRGLRAVTPDGQVSACTESSRSSDSDPFLVGRLDRPSRQLIIIPLREEALRSRTADSLPHCSTCYMRDTCAGGCMSRARAQTGSIFERDPVQCMLARRINPQMAAAIADGDLVPDPGWLPLTAELPAWSGPSEAGARPAGRLVALVPSYARSPWLAHPDRRPFILPPPDASCWFSRPARPLPSIVQEDVHDDAQPRSSRSGYPRTPGRGPRVPGASPA
jgi:uncharacterized protein